MRLTWQTVWGGVPAAAVLHVGCGAPLSTEKERLGGPLMGYKLNSGEHL